MHFANQALLINMATLLWAMDIKPPTDKNGTPVLPSPTQWQDDGLVVCVFMCSRYSLELDADYTTVLHRRPAPFDCRLSPRFDGVHDVLNAAYADH